MNISIESKYELNLNGQLIKLTKEEARRLLNLLEDALDVNKVSIIYKEINPYPQLHPPYTINYCGGGGGGGAGAGASGGSNDLDLMSPIIIKEVATAGDEH